MGFREEVDRIAPRLRRFARALVPGDFDARPETADALVQETVLRAVRSEKLIEPASLAHWLFATLIDIHLTSLKRPAFVRPGKPERVPQSPKARERNPAIDPVGALGDALEALAPDDRVAFLLVCLESFSYDDAAEIVRAPRPVVVQRLVRARNQMAGAFDASLLAADRAGRHPHLRLVK